MIKGVKLICFYGPESTGKTIMAKRRPNTDVPWVADGLRDLHDKRKEMFEIFRSELEKRKIPYTNVQGTYAERERFLIHQVNEIFLTFPNR